MPARSGGRKVVVENLRDQAVEIHHGGDVVVVPPFEKVELPDVRTGGDHLAELARQELVSVEPVKPTRAAAPTRRRAAATRSRSTGARRKRSGKKTNPPKKPPEGGS